MRGFIALSLAWSPFTTCTLALGAGRLGCTAHLFGQGLPANDGFILLPRTPEGIRFNTTLQVERVDVPSRGQHRH